MRIAVKDAIGTRLIWPAWELRSAPGGCGSVSFRQQDAIGLAEARRAR